MNTRPHIICGRSNKATLTERGIEQARKLGDHMFRHGITPSRVHASPALRTTQTAEIALDTMGLNIEPIINKELQELDSGDWVGAVRNEKYTEAMQAEITRLGKDFSPPGGESMNDVSDRMIKWLHNNMDDGIESNECVFVFTHGIAIRCLASSLHGWAQSETYHAVTENVSISLFSHDNNRWRLEYLGWTPFDVWSYR